MGRGGTVQVSGMGELIVWVRVCPRGLFGGDLQLLLAASRKKAVVEPLLRGHDVVQPSFPSRWY